MKHNETCIARLRSLYAAWGYSQWRMRKFEEYDLYLHNKTFLTSDHIITFTEPNGKLMALRPDVTLSIVKNSRPGTGVQKVYYKENVYRVDRDAGRFREITQVGLECLGDVDLYDKREVLGLALDSLSTMGPRYVLEVSHLGILSAVLDEMGAGEEVRADLLHCVGEKNSHGIRDLCREAGLVPDALLSLLAVGGTPAAALSALSALPMTDAGREAVGELSALLAGYEDAPVQLDFSVVNDMNYYNGIVFRGFLAGVPAGVLSGGQYDYLLQKMGKGGRAIGFAVYPELLENLAPPAAGPDVDILLLYEAGTDPAAVQKAAAAWVREGKSVAVHKEVPDKMRYGQLCRMTEKGVEVVG